MEIQSTCSAVGNGGGGGGVSDGKTVPEHRITLRIRPRHHIAQIIFIPKPSPLLGMKHFSTSVLGLSETRGCLI